MPDANNSAGHESLRGMIAKLKQLKKLPEQAAPSVAVALDSEIKRNIAAGVGPDGTPWPKTKDGRQPLVNAGRALKVTAIGSVVVARLDGHHARHHLGAVKGKVKRPILPSKKVPAPVAKAITRVVTAEFAKVMNGGAA